MGKGSCSSPEGWGSGVLLMVIDLELGNSLPSGSRTWPYFAFQLPVGFSLDPRTFVDLRSFRPLRVGLGDRVLRSGTSTDGSSTGRRQALKETCSALRRAGTSRKVGFSNLPKLPSRHPMCSSPEATYHRAMANAARQARQKLLQHELLAAVSELRNIGDRLAAVADEIEAQTEEEACPSRTR